MYIIFEEHQYAAEDVKVALHGISELQDINKNVSVSYVGYYYEPAIPDCVFILPKVLLNDKDQLVVGPNQTIDPKEIITPEGQQKYLTQEYRKFLYEFAVWIYRTIAVYHQHKPDSQAIYYRRLPRSGKGMRHQANTYLDIILSLIQFNQENQDFFLYTVKNIHSDTTKSTGRGPSHNQKPSSKTALRFIWIPSTANGKSISTRSCSSSSSPSLTMSTASMDSVHPSICNMSCSLRRSLRPIAKATARPD